MGQSEYYIVQVVKSPGNRVYLTMVPPESGFLCADAITMGPDGLQVICRKSSPSSRKLSRLKRGAGEVREVTYEPHRKAYFEAMTLLKNTIPMIFEDRPIWKKIERSPQVESIMPCTSGSCKLYRDPFLRTFIQWDEKGGYSLLFNSASGNKFLFKNLSEELFTSAGLVFMLQEECNPTIPGFHLKNR